ncbi:MAG: hypothetical protein QM610_06330 [Chitinophagaceae bacterium]
MLIQIHPLSNSIYGTVCIVVGIALFLIVGRRRFYRRNQAGLETYSSYSSAVANGCLNKSLKLLGLGLLFIGIMIRFMACAHQEMELKKQKQAEQHSKEQPPKKKK